ncbi:MAG: MGDG synthase family glycosyltransferase [Candidatus Kapaibacterium sp.]
MSTPFKKILILSVSAGAGHVRAAEALVEQFSRDQLAPEIVHMDILKYTSKAMRTVYSKAYFDVAKAAPELLGWIYDYLDKPWKNEKRIRALELLNISLLVKVLERIQPDVVVSTHFLAADIITYLRRKKKYSCPQAVVITDFDAHALWLNRDVDLYCAACEEERAYLMALGMPPDKVVTTGIPIHPVFAEEKDRTAMRRKHGLPADKPVILVSAGGFGITNIEHIVEALTRLTLPVTIVVLCGSNERAVEVLRATFADTAAPHTVIPIGHTTEMDEYMSAADLLIGKPGGLTSSEVLAKHLPMIIVNPIPGQEERNTDFLLEHGAAWKCNNIPVLTYKVGALLESPDATARMKRSAADVATPKAAAAVAAALRRAFAKDHGPSGDSNVAGG